MGDSRATYAAAAIVALLIGAAALLGPRSERLSGIINPSISATLQAASSGPLDKRHKEKPYTSPSGLFIQVSRRQSTSSQRGLVML